MSDDGSTSIVVIAMLGNPFSPAYARATKAKTSPNPLSYSALNIGIYRRGHKAWALTEQRVLPHQRTTDSLEIGESSMNWQGDQLVVDVRERMPWTRRPIRGRLTFTPDLATNERFSLEASGRHSWWPVAPSGHLHVQLQEPNLQFTARGYHDTNAGDEPLYAGFKDWTWSRAHVGPRTFITYDVRNKTDDTMRRALSIGRDGVREEHGLGLGLLPRSRWGIDRDARTNDGFSPRIVHNLEDTPFYCRDLIETRIDGRVVRAMHETLSGDRLGMRAVQMLLPFRMRSV